MVRDVALQCAQHPVGNSPWWLSFNFLKSVIPIGLGAPRNSGATSASQTAANGSMRELQQRRGVCDVSATLHLIRRALRSLMPALAAASSCDLFLVCRPSL